MTPLNTRMIDGELYVNAADVTAGIRAKAAQPDLTSLEVTALWTIANQLDTAARDFTSEAAEPSRLGGLLIGLFTGVAVTLIIIGLAFAFLIR